MEQSFVLPSELTKAERYEAFLRQFEALVEGVDDEISVMANASAALHEAFGFFWVGFYRVKGEEFVLGPFQGSVACYRIKYGRGVCGTAWAQGQTVVVPVFSTGEKREVRCVLDIDSEHYATFDDTDRCYLERLATILSRTLY